MSEHGFLNGKRALIVGLASNRSIAYGVAQAMHQQGAELAFACQNDRLQPRVAKMAAEFDSELCYSCDVAKDDDIESLMNNIKNHWSSIDILVHSVAFAPSDQLTGDFLENISREGFSIAHDISSYSLAAITKAAHQCDLLKSGSSIVAMTYLGSNRVVPSYNTMGLAKASLEANVRYLALCLGPKNIRVNAISAGPIRTLAASGIKDFRKMLDFNERAAPLQKNVSIEEVGHSAAFLCSDMASGITGEILHVDAGYHIVGMTSTESAS